MSCSVVDRRSIGPRLTSKTCSFSNASVRGRWLAWQPNVCTDRGGRLTVSLYHERRLSFIAVCFRADVWLSSLDDAVAPTWYPLGDERRTLLLVALSISSNSCWWRGRRLRPWRYSVRSVFWKWTTSYGSTKHPRLSQACGAPSPWKWIGCIAPRGLQLAWSPYVDWAASGVDRQVG